MKRRCATILCALAFLGTATPLSAQFYVAGYIGGAKTHRTDVTVEISSPTARLTFDAVRFRGRSFDSPLYYGYRAGYFLTRRFAVEAEFIHAKIYADLDEPISIRGTLEGAEVREQAPMSRYAPQFNVSHGLNMLLINGVFRQPLIEDRLSLLVRAGTGPTIPHPEVTIFGPSTSHYELGPIAIQGAGGVELRLWRGLHTLAEYKYTFTPSRFDIANGSARLDVHSHHAVAGLAVYF